MGGIRSERRREGGGRGGGEGGEERRLVRQNFFIHTPECENKTDT